MASGVEGEVVRGDPALRRRVLLAGPFVLALGVAALATAPRASRLLILWLQEPEGRSWQTLRSHRFPPPGMRVMRDTPVVRGGPAHLLGACGLGLAALLLLAGSVLPVIAYRIGAVLRDGCPRAMPAASMLE